MRKPEQFLPNSSHPSKTLHSGSQPNWLSPGRVSARFWPGWGCSPEWTWRISSAQLGFASKAIHRRDPGLKNPRENEVESNSYPIVGNVFFWNIRLKSTNRHIRHVESNKQIWIRRIIAIIFSRISCHHISSHLMGWDENIVYHHFRINNWNKIDPSTNK